MSLLLLEALGAMVILLAIVWWTMFSGRERGELKRPEQTDVEDEKGIKPASDKDS
jgi:hypothetical protein